MPLARALPPAFALPHSYAALLHLHFSRASRLYALFARTLCTAALRHCALLPRASSFFLCTLSLSPHTACLTHSPLHLTPLTSHLHLSLPHTTHLLSCKRVCLLLFFCWLSCMPLYRASWRALLPPSRTLTTRGADRADVLPPLNKRMPRVGWRERYRVPRVGVLSSRCQRACLLFLRTSSSCTYPRRLHAPWFEHMAAP